MFGLLCDKGAGLVVSRGIIGSDARVITAAITFLEFRKWQEIKEQPDYGLKSINPCVGDWCWEMDRGKETVKGGWCQTTCGYF